MSASRNLSGIYIAAASAFTVAVILASRPDPDRGFLAPPAAVEHQQNAAPPRLEFIWLAQEATPQARLARLTRNRATVPAGPLRRAHKHARHSDIAARQVGRSKRTATVAPSFPSPLPMTKQTALVEERLRSNLTSELYDNFELFLYVSKAPVGPWAQRMYVFRKEAAGNLVPLYAWPVSTGRERDEYNSRGLSLPSYTPSGYYELDPQRFFTHHVSSQWGEPMPFAMFFNWLKNGTRTGVAIHSAVGDEVADLGTRASAGCIRLAPDAARTLFTLIRAQYRGLAPRFAIDRRTGTMSNAGIVLHDATGRPELAEGYRVLVFIENYGGQDIVAAMY